MITLRNNGMYEMTCKVRGVECDVSVDATNYPANKCFPAGWEVHGVYFEDEGDVSGEMTDEEIDAVVRILGTGED